MITDPIGDLLTRIRNGQLRRKAKISSPNSPNPAKRDHLNTRLMMKKVVILAKKKMC